jgi:Txe/YoeB family toxin of Txe-Axe toxin-antitoxin module
MAGCGCKKKNNQPNVGSSTVTIQLTEGNNQIQQQNSLMERQVEELVKKIEEINDTLDTTPNAE